MTLSHIHKSTFQQTNPGKSLWAKQVRSAYARLSALLSFSDCKNCMSLTFIDSRTSLRTDWLYVKARCPLFPPDMEQIFLNMAQLYTEFMQMLFLVLFHTVKTRHRRCSVSSWALWTKTTDSNNRQYKLSWRQNYPEGTVDKSYLKYNHLIILPVHSCLFAQFDIAVRKVEGTLGEKIYGLHAPISTKRGSDWTIPSPTYHITSNAISVLHTTQI